MAWSSAKRYFVSGQFQVVTLETLLEEKCALAQRLDSLAEQNAQMLQAMQAALEQNRTLAAENTQLKARVVELERQLAESQREAKRQAAPFRRKNRIPKEKHKKPGRKPGHKPDWRQPPDNVDKTVEVPLECCPECGCALEDVHDHDHFVDDIPPPPRPTTTRYKTQSGRCPRCKVRRHSSHPDLPNITSGAAGTMLGHGVAALAVQMRVQFGAPLRKIAAFLSLWLNFRVTASGLLGALERTAAALQPTRKAIQVSLQQAKAVHADETGWRLLCASAWAWVFTSATHTLYVISPTRGHEVILTILGPEFAGFLHSDCMGAYDVLYAAEKKPKCNSHFLTGLKEAEGLQLLAGSLEATWPRAVIDLLKDAIDLKKRKPELAAKVYQDQCRSVGIQLDVLLGQVGELTEPGNIRMANRLRKHREGVLLFLEHDEVQATNNHAERQIRPFVIFRKLSGGNRSELGAAALATLASVWATACQQGLNFASVVISALRNRGQSAIPLLDA